MTAGAEVRKTDVVAGLKAVRLLELRRRYATAG